MGDKIDVLGWVKKDPSLCLLLGDALTPIKKNKKLSSTRGGESTLEHKGQHSSGQGWEGWDNLVITLSKSWNHRMA